MAATAWFPVTQAKVTVYPKQPEHVCLAIATELWPMGLGERLIEIGEDEASTHAVLTKDQAMQLVLALGQALGIDVDQPRNQPAQEE